jgi:4-hydroxy-tetrahydrodipicolinate synthase
MALPYSRSEVKERARENWRGACNVTLPSFSADLTSLNEAAIEHDIRRSAELGFWGTLVASECGTTSEEYVRFMELAAAAAPEGFKLVAHISTDTLDQMIPVAKAAEDFGYEAALPAYPPTFVPKSAEEIVSFTRELSERTDLALILFAVMTWGYRSLTPRGFPHDAIVEMAKLETAAAVKYEASPPGIVTGVADLLKRCGDDVLVECPMETTAPALIDWFGMQWIGTSGYESFGDRVPRWFAMVHEGRWDEAMDLYWSYQSLREAKGAISASVAGANLIHRVMWKYLGWLHGFNGGLLRMPQMRLQPGQMSRLRAAAEASGYDIPADDADFYTGRHPS